MFEFQIILICLLAAIVLFIFIGLKNNVADWEHFIVNVVDGWIRIYCRYYHHFIYQPIPVSNNNPALLACNHLSGLDPFLIVAACRRPIRFMIAKEEYERFGLRWLFRLAGCIPVERSGRVETAFRAALTSLHNGEVVALFPEGGINRTGRPLRKLKAGIIKLAKKSNVPITALRVEGMRSQGHTVWPLFLPSQCRLYVLPELDCVNKTDEQGLIQLGIFLAMKR
ncbi:MAG: 1-acyl-sn-glycerol-3-phosphate acyltransferase [Gammaproteobacteria bacterium]|nr:1-acyl-sn-glycerol-3-phosphate acyltransferase [Gammaproteobacteria bacterium]